MQPHHRGHIVKAEPIALHVVQVAVGHTVELVEDMLLMSLCNSHAIVANLDNDIAVGDFRARDANPHLLTGVFHCIVAYIADYLHKMLAVGIESKTIGGNRK